MVKRLEPKNKSASLNEVREKTYALIYCRVSSERQRTEGHGLDAQEARCREYSEEKNLVIQENYIYRERATGAGSSEENRALQVKIIQDIDKYPFRNFVVVIDDLSRIARDTKGYLSFKEKLKKREVNFMCPNFQFDDTPEGDYIETVVTAGNELQRKVNRRQVIQKQKARLDAGYWAFGSKKGYDMIKDPQHGKILTPNKEGLEMLKPALEGFANGIFVRKVDVCKFLVEKGFWQRQHPSAYIDKLDFILRDPANIGDIEYLPWEVSRRLGHHNGIIDELTYNLIQNRLDKKGINRIRINVSEDFPLRGLLVCAGCGHFITAAWTTARGKSFPYYFCQNGLCEFGKKSARRKNVEDGFKDLLEKNKLKPEIENLVQVVFEKVWKDEVSNSELERKKGLQLKFSLQEKIENLTEMAVQSKSDSIRKIYEEQIEKVMAEIERVECKSIEKIDLSVPYRNALDKAIGLVKSPYAVWQKLPLLEKHQLFFFLFDEKLEYSKKEGYRNDNLPCAVRLFEDFATSNTLDVEKGASKPRANKF